MFVEFISDNYLCGDGFELSWVTDYSPEGIEEMIEEEIAVYPNPACSTVHVRIPAQKGGADVMLYDVTGRMVLAEMDVVDAVDLNINTLPNGFYTLMIRNGSSTYKKKIVIQH